MTTYKLYKNSQSFVYRQKPQQHTNHNSDNTYNHPPAISGSHALGDLPRVPALYEEPVGNRIFPNHSLVVPQDYETAFSNAELGHVYSTVETASQEAQDYLSASTYTSLNPKTIDREQNAYSFPNHQQTAIAKITPAGQKSIQLERTYFTLQNENAVN